MAFRRPGRAAFRHAAPRAGDARTRRFSLLFVFFAVAAGVIVLRLFGVMVISHGFYETLAADARDVFSKLVSVRGDILLRDRDGKLYPVATNKDTFIVFAEPRNVERAGELADLLAPMLVLDRDALAAKLEGKGLYAPLARGVPEDLATQIRDLLKERGFAGIGMTREPARVYPEPGMGGHVLGFVGSDEKGERRGRYGIEGYWDEELAGTPGSIDGEEDVAGRLIPVAERRIIPATQGADIVLTIDRSVQFFVCTALAQTVARHGAAGGSVIVMDPKTGAILAMCGAPDFDPNAYSAASDISVFNNPAVFSQYEPGSVMKAMTMAAAIDAGKIGPKTTYEDEGEVKLGPYTIRNSDGKAYGMQTMTEVLEKSLNTGAIFAERQIGVDGLRATLERFGFGAATGIELATETKGDLSSLTRKGEIFGATASYGQGIAATPLQVTMAFGAIANGGTLMAPRIVSEIRWSEDRVEERPPKAVRQTVSARTATLLGGMLVSVVENGHGKRAGVPGYWVAGKTGTAQVPRADGPGYRTDVTIGTFAGFAPVEDPRFVMTVRIDHPQDVKFAESTAAPLFGEIARYLLQYYRVPPSRPMR